MNDQQIESIRARLCIAVSAFDAKASRQRFYNPNALSIYLERIECVVDEIKSGTSPRQAILAGFNDRLCDACLKAIGEPPFSKEEMSKQALTYG